MPTAGGGWQDDAEANLEGGPTGPLMAPAEIGIPTAKGKEKKREEYVLLLEFNDGTLQGPKATAKGKRMGNTRKKVAP